MSSLIPVVDNVEERIKNQSYQSAAANAFAAISEINVPLHYVSNFIT